MEKIFYKDINECVYYEKLDNGLIPRQQMIEMIRKSKDFDSEKLRAIEALGGEYNEWRE